MFVLIQKMLEILRDVVMVVAVIVCICCSGVSKLVGWWGASLCDSLTFEEVTYPKGVAELLVLPLVVVVLSALVLYSISETAIEYIVALPVEK